MGGPGVLDAVKVLAVPPSTPVGADLISRAPTDSPNVEDLARILPSRAAAVSLSSSQRTARRARTTHSR